VDVLSVDILLVVAIFDLFERFLVVFGCLPEICCQGPDVLEILRGSRDPAFLAIVRIFQLTNAIPKYGQGLLQV
jgi:hypothetical protein